MENYPQLRANEQFNRLMDELSGTENRIAVERMRYNEAVQAYNTSRRQFPANITNRDLQLQGLPVLRGTEAARRFRRSTSARPNNGDIGEGRWA